MKSLLDFGGLIPQEFCSTWHAEMLWLIGGSNLVTACACLFVLFALVTLLLRWRSAPDKRALGLFAAFIVACAAAHLLKSVTLWIPLYRLSALVDAVTALLATATAIVAWPVLNKIFGAEQEMRGVRSLAESARRELEEKAMTDSLTRLANRRHFDAFLDAEIRRAKRAGTSIAVIMLDADKFKPFNDLYGHPSGDACLRLISTAISGQLRRAGDLAARFGGDEFAVILPGADESGALMIAERIVKAIQAIAILHPANASGIVTASAGVAAIVPSLSKFEAEHLVKLADAALYTAKNRGGNRVCLVGQASTDQTSIFDDQESKRALDAGESEPNWTPRMPIDTDFVGILRGLPFGVLVTDGAQPDDPIVFANAGFEKMTGYGLKETVGRNSRFLQGADTDRRMVADLAEAIRQGLPIRRELLNYRKDGQAFWNDLSMQPLLDRHGTVVGYVSLLIDETARHRAEDSRRDSEAKLAAIVENLPGYIFQRVLRADGVPVYSYFSKSYWRLLGVEDVPQAAEHTKFPNIHPADAEKVRIAIDRSVADLSTCTIEFRSIRADGEVLWLRTQSSPRRLGNGKVVWDGVGIDITAEVAAKESLAYLAYHDPLTGLCSRVLFVKTLEEMCAPGLEDSQRIAVFSIDLDSFQHVNDIFGSSIGDTVLRCVADRLAEFAGASGVSARLGGDEFGVAIADLPREITVAEKTTLLCHMLQRPMHIGQHEISIQVCVGASHHQSADGSLPMAAASAEDLVKQSNFALAEAKRAGKGVFRLYSKQLDDRERNRTMLRQSMRRGLDEEQFVLHYHPIVDLATGQIVGAEALIRWAHPILGLQRPDLFIPEAESSGLIVPLGAWALRTALLEMREWKNHCDRSLRVGINVSAVQLANPNFVSIVETALTETGADPALVDLELTESGLIDTSVSSVLDALKTLGCRLAVDDFGTGYSSFRYLRTLPVSTVKIDQAFVRHMVIDSSDASIVRAIVAVAKSLGLAVIAEGIETPLQRDFLRDEGCHVGQGYLFSLPLTAEDFRWMLASEATLPLDDGYAPPGQSGQARHSGLQKLSDVGTKSPEEVV